MRGIVIVLVVVLAGCVERVAPAPIDGGSDQAVDAEGVDEGFADLGADLPPDCGGCGAGLTCCANPWAIAGGQPAVCVDLQIHPEHCGRCGNACPTCDDQNGQCACQGGQCLTPAACTVDADCGAGQACSEQVCCGLGTEFFRNPIGLPISWVGCCPTGMVCGCYGYACPLSRRSAKTAIRYLTAANVDAARDRLLSIHLADYEYRRAPGRRHLGFIIDDLDEATARACVAPDGEHVDVYGYISLAVAALQAQQREIDGLRREVAELRRLARRRQR
jgi:hypothetical protein